MDGNVTVKYRIERAPPRRGPTLATEASAAKATPPPPKVSASRTARLLALAHCIERLIEAGTLRDYSDAARRFRLSRARITQLSNLLALSPRLQEAILTERIVVAERKLRTVLQHATWEEQGMHVVNATA